MRVTHQFISQQPARRLKRSAAAAAAIGRRKTSRFLAKRSGDGLEPDKRWRSILQFERQTNSMVRVKRVREFARARTCHDRARPPPRPQNTRLGKIVRGARVVLRMQAVTYVDPAANRQVCVRLCSATIQEDYSLA